MEARIWELEKASKAPEVIDVDASVENMVVFSAIEALRTDTEAAWKRLAGPLEQVITARSS